MGITSPLTVFYLDMQQFLKPKDRVLITGCGGMLGAAVFEVFSKAFTHVYATDIDLNAAWLHPLDVRNIHDVEQVFADEKPTIVLHLAALTDLEVCERDAANAWATNALGTENVAMLAEKYGATLVYISTAGVFDGTKDEYVDFDLPNPINIYGASKYHGENFIPQHVSKYFIFRAGWMMGGGPTKDKKFINKIFKQIQAGATELRVVDDKVGTPTYTYDFANSILNMLQTDYYGLYNQVSTGGASRYDVAVEFVRLLGLSEKIRVTKISSDEIKAEYFAARPASEKMINLKLNNRGLNTMRHWKDCLTDYSVVYNEALKK